MNQGAPVVVRLSNCLIKPHCVLEESQHFCYLTEMDLKLLNFGYIQAGLLFHKPQHVDMLSLVERLKHSLSRTLTCFHPLTGRFVTEITQEPPSCSIFLHCTDGPGAGFIHAVSEATMSDILSPLYVPQFVDSLFPLERPINHDGHMLPVLAVQVTELFDGVFIGCSFNHAVADGASFWHFLNTWSELSRSTEETFFQPLIMKRWFINEDVPRIISLPYSHPDQFVERYLPKPYKERIFHFTPQSIAKLKAKCNADLRTDAISVSSFQALCAQVWRSVTRARGLLADHKTQLMFPIDVRSRLEPPLPRECFGNCFLLAAITTTAGEMLSNSLGWAASLVHKEIAAYTNEKVRSILGLQPSTAIPFGFGQFDTTSNVVVGMSPRFDVYTNDFGWGKPVAVRSGFGIKWGGKVTWFPGQDGGGSMDLEICLDAQSMSALETDDELTSAVSPCMPTTGRLGN